MKLPRRTFLYLSAGAAALSALPRVARAQAYPARTVTIIVPVAAGGTTDVTARIIGQYMSQLFGQQFVIENVTGAGGTTGSTRAMRSRPDGYTILMGHTGTHAFSVSFYPNLAYKPDVDFEPIGAVLEIPELIVARKDLPPRDLKEFIAYAKGNAEKLNVGHAPADPRQAHRCARPGTRRRQRAQASCRYRRQRSRQGKARSAASRRAGEERNCPLDADHQGREYQGRINPARV